MNGGHGLSKASAVRTKNKYGFSKACVVRMRGGHGLSRAGLTTGATRGRTIKTRGKCCTARART
eukprot:12077561-Alexandrium_andersonii.AAC.1